MSDVIAAVSTGRQVSAIGILRLSGDGAVAVAGQVFRAVNGSPLSEAPNRKMTLGHLLDAHGRTLDEVLAVVARGPRSYTGEDTVEFQCHGSPAVLAAGLEALFAAGARQAGPGEFTKRAFLNGCMDLSQAEAVVDLIDAETADAAVNAAGQLGGAVRRRVEPVYDRLTDLCAHFHAVLDYPDEDIAPFALESYAAALDADIAALRRMFDSFGRGQILKNGLDTVILGRPNVGKSSLLNALAGYDRVIVTDVAGTTRDTVTESVRLGGLLLRLTDTAGIRETKDAVEKLGVARAEEAAGHARLALCVFDASRRLTEEDDRVIDAASSAETAVAVLNKSDLPAAIVPSDLPFELVVPLSAKTGEGLDLLAEAVEMLWPEDAPCDGSILTNARQADAVGRAGAALERAAASMRAGMTPDAVLLDVEDAMSALGEITGKTVREDITNRIFSRFCVGK